MRRTVTAIGLAAILTACGSALPDVAEGLPGEIGGVERTQRSLAGDARFAAALEAEGVESDLVTGHEVRWGDDVRLVLLRFEEVGLNEPANAARTLLGISNTQVAVGVLGNQTVMTLTGEEVDGVAYNVALSGEGSEIVMATLVAPSDAEAEPIVRALVEALPRD
jgi:hypothetical protein